MSRSGVMACALPCLLAVLACLVPNAAQAQHPKATEEPPPAPFPLRLSGQKPVQNRGVSFLWLPVQCDAAGNVYARLGDGPRPFPPVVKISPQGEELATFSVESAGNYNRNSALDYALGPGYRFYFLTGHRVEKKDQIVVLEFDPDGSLASTITLDTRFVPLKLAAFKSGGFLVSGMSSVKTIEEPRRPFTAVVKSTGEVQEIKLSGDVSPPEAPAESPGPPGTEGTAPPKEIPPAVVNWARGAQQLLMHEIGLGEAVGAEDGNVYLFRLSQTPFVYVIQPGGEVLKRLELKIPWPGYEAVNFGVAGGRIVLDTLIPAAQRAPGKQADSRRLALYNAESGEFLYGYEVPEEAGAMACFAPSGLTFLATDKINAHMVLQFAPF